MCAVLRGERPVWRRGGNAGLVDAFAERSAYHGVQGLLYEQLHAAPDWPQGLLEALRGQATANAMWELRHQQIVAEAVAALARAGIEPVLFKGTALAYSLYTDPALRSRGDTDLYVPPRDRERALAILAELGFRRVFELSELASYQACLIRRVAGEAHTLDLHWKISNSELLSRLFDYDELRRDAAPLAALSPHTLAAGPVHALLIACMHRAGHDQAPYFVDGVAHHSGDRLIWLYDIHLLAGALSPAQWEEFFKLAGRKGLRAVCLQGIEMARACFTTLVPLHVLEGLAAPARELAAEYLGAKHLRRRWLDLCAHDTLGAKLRFAAALAFPPANYMRERFPDVRPNWLPWLYALRAVGGLHTRRAGR